MTDSNSVHDDYESLVQLAGELYTLWQVENRDAVWRSNGGTHVSGGGHGDPTSTAASRPGAYRDRDRIAGRLKHHRDRLEDTLSTLRPALTGRPCKVTDCEGDGLTPDGRCADCSDYARRNHGITPDQVHSVDADGNPISGRSLVHDRNDRRPRECGCSTACCPDGCLDLVPPGKGRMSDRCYQRQSRARREEREAS